MFGQCYPNGEAPAIGRVAALDAGLPVEVARAAARPALRLGAAGGDRRAAMQRADRRGRPGARRRRREHEPGRATTRSQLRWGARSGGAMLADRLARGRVTAGGDNYPVPGGMLETAENLRARVRDRRARSRTSSRCARTSARSPPSERRALRRGDRPGRRSATGRGTRSSTATSIPAPTPRSRALATLKPVDAASDPESTVTAGNSSGQNDGAAVCIVTTPEKAAELGLRPLARLVSWARRRRAAADDGHRPGPGHRRRRSTAPG